MTPDSLGVKNRYLASLLAEGTNTSPIKSPWQGASRMAHALLAGLEMRDQDAQGKEANQWMGQMLMGGQQPTAQPQTASPSMVTALAPKADRVYQESEFNPLDAKVATPAELSHGVPDFVPQQYRPVMGKAAVDSDIPVDVLARQTKQESGFRPDVINGQRTSSAGAQGISQFMPKTASAMGINPLDPQQAIPAQAAYLRENVDRFGGSIPHGLAAYNGGPTRLAGVGGDISRMPAETQNYVRSISGNQAPQPQPQQTADTSSALRSQIQQGLNSPNPAIRAQAQALAQSMINKQLEGEKPTDETREYQLYLKQGGNKTFFDYKTDLKKAGAQNTVINNTVNPILKGVGERFVEDLGKAKSASTMIGTLHEARKQIDGGAITGALADQRLGLQKLGALFGLSPDQVANTETFQATMGGVVLDLVKGLGSGSGISNADRDYAERVAGGRIGLDETSIRRLLDIGERAARARIKGVNTDADRLMKAQPDEFKTIAPLMRIDEPGEYVAQQQQRIRRFNPTTGKIE
jgi:soluble lytic murein transglycosylase-like protein